MKEYVVRFTERQALAVVEVSRLLCDELGPPKRGTALDAFSTAGVEMDEAMANQDRPWEKCKPCNGSGWIEGAA